jgi:hypothetical protein
MQFELTLPAQAGKCQAVGELSGTGPVRSYRDFEVR